jgi:hypothetical protein
VKRRVGKAVITWVAFASADVAEYSVRTAPAPTYKAADESVVRNVGADVLTFASDAGLTVPGATALFRCTR